MNYLASSFQAMHPAKDEHRLQRNKAIVMAIFVVLIIIVLMALLLR
jgi:predicted nucleic acid-binding Zn ribbon protein